MDLEEPGFEPGAFCMRSGHSTTELHPHLNLLSLKCVTKQEQIMLIDLRRSGFEGSNPEESLDTTCQDISDMGPDFAYKTFFGVGSLEL